MAKGKIVKNQGWKMAYEQELEEEAEDEEIRDQILPPRKVGEELSVDRIGFTSGKTKPPARFNEARLVGSDGKSGAIYADQGCSGSEDAGRDWRSGYCGYQSGYHRKTVPLFF